MAKKQQQKLSYGPNLGLVGGARDVALSEVAKTSAGGQAFAMGLTTSVLAGLEAKKEREDKMDACLDDLGGIENINLLDQGYNKEAVTQFLRDGRDQYAILAEEFERTGDRAVRDKMDEIKFSFQNLNNQLQGLAKERRDYADAYDKGQLVTLENGDERFVDMYTNKSAFGISANGDIGYVSGDGSYTKFKDVAGKWNTKNNIAETFLLQQNLNSRKLGENNKTFYRDDTKNLYSAKFNETGPEGIMVMAKTDLTGDNNYVLPNGQEAGNLSFESMWSQGLLDDKFYQQIPKGTDSKWMYNKENVDVLNNLMSEYYTDVTESFHGQGKSNYDAKQQQQGQQGGLPDYLETSFGSKSKMRASNFVNNIQSGKKDLRDLKGREYVLQADGKYKTRFVGEETGVHHYFTPVQLMELNEMDAYFPNTYKDILNTPLTEPEYQQSIPSVKNAEEGGFYQNPKTKQKYQFTGGKYVEVYTPKS